MKIKLQNGCSRFMNLALIKCLGIKDITCHLEELLTYISMQYLTICDCPCFTTCSLSMVGKLCPGLQQIDLSKFFGVTDVGILPLLDSSQSELVKVNLEGCVSLSDAIISSLVKAHKLTIAMQVNTSLQSWEISLASTFTDKIVLLSGVNPSRSRVGDTHTKENHGRREVGQGGHDFGSSLELNVIIGLALRRYHPNTAMLPSKGYNASSFS
ncbi:EIN3-binding F-box protein 1 [Dendrobium catenatum]|uniref:EIN3-binding F-box protein 1 n=1 Tax=Dendrobium catenatum TaxID=906689 RepID=A0A2I0XAD3_9ASPA|nr:EIN3-binding F-box protein 1 [Dendrobium catenatum]